MTKPDDPNDNRTMELDAVDDAAEVSLEDGDVSAESDAGARARFTPPPLPPEASLPPAPPRASMPAPAAAAPPPKSRALLYGAILLGVLVVGLFGGSRIAGMMRGSTTAAASPSASASGAQKVITIPTVELGSEGEQDAGAP